MKTRFLTAATFAFVVAVALVAQALGLPSSSPPRTPNARTS